MHRLFHLVAILVMLVALLSPAQRALAADVDLALTWLRAQQQPDGGFLGFSGASDPGMSADVALAFAAAGVDPASVSNGGPSLLDFLRQSAGAYGTTTGGAAKLTFAAVSAGADPRRFGGVDLVSRLTFSADRGSGLLDPQLYVHALAMLALAAAGEPIPPAAVLALTDRQISDGSWAFTGATDPGQGDSNTTAIAIQALAAAGQSRSPVVESGLRYLTAASTLTGGVVYQAGKEDPPVADANSTALALQARLAAGAGQGSDAVARTRDALDAFQNPSGAFHFRPDARDDNLLSTAQAIPALRGIALPARQPSSGQGAVPSIMPGTGGGTPLLPAAAIPLAAASLALAAGVTLRIRRRGRA